MSVPEKRITKDDIKKIHLEKNKLERALNLMRNVKVENYLKIQRVGIQKYERKFMRECTRGFELDLLMLLDECLLQNMNSALSDLSDSDDDEPTKIQKSFDTLFDFTKKAKSLTERVMKNEGVDELTSMNANTNTYSRLLDDKLMINENSHIKNKVLKAKEKIQKRALDDFNFNCCID